MPEKSASTVLLDIDGTLVDTNYLHVDAWSRALADVDRPVDAWRVHRVIGMDSGRLLADLLGDDADRLGDAAKQRHAHHYAAQRPRMRAFAGARDLLHELAGRGFQVVLATSSPPEEYAMTTGVLDPGDAVAASTTSEDVETAKPAPDVIGVALQKARARPDDAVMIGDAVWDVESASTAGVRCIGVLTGGVGRAELLGAGAIAVYDDVAALLDGLDGSPLHRH